MWSYLLSVNACRGFIGLIGAIFVIIGVIKTDSDYDNFGKTDSPYGAFFFFSGWLLFAASIGFINQSAAGFVFSWKALFGFVGFALVIVAASLSQVVMYKKDVKMMRAHLIFFIISWIFTAYAIAMPAYAFLPIHYKRFFIALLGAFGVIYGIGSGCGRRVGPGDYRQGHFPSPEAVVGDSGYGRYAGRLAVEAGSRCYQRRASAARIERQHET